MAISETKLFLLSG